MVFQEMWSAAALSNGAMITCLWLAWRRRSRAWLALGLSGNAGALWLWTRLFGVEFGILFWLGTMALGAWACIVLKAPLGHVGGHRRKPFRTAKFPKVDALLRGAAIAMLAGPAALAASLVASLHVVYWLTADLANRWVTAAFLLPLMWALVMTISLCSSSRLRVAAFVVLFTVLGAALLPRGGLT